MAKKTKEPKEKKAEEVKRTHSELSPSNAERWWNCPGSVALCRTVARRPQSEDAAEGEAAHDVLERCLKQYLVDRTFLNPFDMVGMEIVVGEFTFEVTDEMAEAVSITIDVVKRELHKGGFLVVEQKVSVCPEVGGRLDIAIVRPYDTVVMIDFKYGRGVLVSAVENKQMLLYCLGLLKEFECPTAILGIVQPRIQSTQDPWSFWEVPAGYLESFEAEMKYRIEMTKDPAAPCVPGDYQCKWCDAKAVCPALRKDLGTALAPVVKGNEVIFPDVKALSLDQLVKILDYAERIEKWLKAVQAHAEGIAMDGGEVPGYALEKKRANRKWKDEEEVAKRFAELGDQLVKAKLISPAALEKLVPERKKEIESLTERPDNGLTLKKVGKK